MKLHFLTLRENKFIKASRILTKIALPVGIVFACISFVSAVVAFFTSPAWQSFFQEIITLIDELFYEIETELLYELGVAGVNIDSKALSSDDCAEKIIEFLKGNEKK